MEARDAAAYSEPHNDGTLDLDQVLNGFRQSVRKLSEDRLVLPPEPPYMEAHNSWVANGPGTLLVIPVGDLAQHVLLGICYLLQNGQVLKDDINGRPIPGLERYADMVDLQNVWPISFFEQWSTAELAVEAVVERKFGAGGPYHAGTPGPWRDSAKVRSADEVHDERFRECVALQAQYLFDIFGKFPATVPSMFCIMYLQAHHLDLDFYDAFYKPGAYLRTHAEHMDKWHS